MLPYPFTSYNSSVTGKDSSGVSSLADVTTAPQQQGFLAEGYTFLQAAARDAICGTRTST